MDAPGVILVLNIGSSSLKFALFKRDGEADALTRGTVALSDLCDDPLDRVLERIAGDGPMTLAGVGHRVVHGGPRLSDPHRVDAALIAELRGLVEFAPEHLPAEIALIEAVARRFPRVPQVACFDTAFHHDLPRLAQLLPIPRRYMAQGARRYGFHGLSYQYLRGELERLGDPAVTEGHVILAHLGAGSSLAALKDGHCVDTSMAFTPAAGLMMGTRSGDIDPGLIAWLIKKESMTAQGLSMLFNHESGLKGVSEISADMRVLLAREAVDARAADAIGLYCRQAKKWIGGFAAVLGGLDTLVFAGGIGEGAAVIRARIVDGLEFLGVDIDAGRNAVHAPLVSSASGRVRVRVLPTNEEVVIARAVRRLIAQA